MTDSSYSPFDSLHPECPDWRRMGPTAFDAGVRAMALSREGSMIDDFKIEARGNAIHVLNAPSPAATAALAIGNAIEETATRQFGLG